MKAVLWEEYGAAEVLRIADVAKPTIGKKDILIAVKATAVNASDTRIRSMDTGGGVVGFFIGLGMRAVIGNNGPRRKIAGSVVSGIVSEVGDSVTTFKVGDEVFGLTGLSFGGCAEFCALPEKRAIALKPKKASFEEAAALPFGGSSALYFLHKAGVKEAKQVLIYGSTGSVGSAAVQVAKYYGSEVDAVCSEGGRALSKKLGASSAHDYKEDVYLHQEKRYDIIFDAVGKINKNKVKHLLKIDGKYITVDSMDVAKEYTSDLELLVQMYDEGKYDLVIDRTYSMDEIVEAHRYVDTGRKKGNVVVTISS